MEYGKFHTYSAGGRLSLALAVVDGRIDYSDKLVEVVYKCMMDGMCDVADKVCRYNVEPLEVLREFRCKLVEEGQILPQHRAVIANLRKEGNMLMKLRADRGKWADGLNVTEISKKPAEVVFHAGCRCNYDDEMKKLARDSVTLLANAGVKLGIMGKDENCCGCRAYEMGFRDEFVKFAESNMEAWKAGGVKTVVTACSDCYYGFKRLYPDMGSKFEVVHVVEYIRRLIAQGKMKLTKKIPMKITYHDPCHLGRLGELYIPWNGTVKKIMGGIPVHEPPKPRYNGAFGVYDLPREVLKAIPGIELVEMERNRENAWCCGAGGGVPDAYPDFAQWTAKERVAEAESTGAESLVTACPWCERHFIDAAKATNSKMEVFDIVELVQKAI